ncbi:unnamed protein product [Polarella glacialis]|uniref:Laminin IV type A domain-containing protein n=2 Tax=Polarella glacialis TaxID=89957 RepID=A0A813GH27_POLGL|nr:unnamed protein product [Polarella glacialis]
MGPLLGVRNLQVVSLRRPPILRLTLGCISLLLWSGGQPSIAIDTGEIAEKSWISNPVARHVACRVEANTPSVCQLAGFEDTYKELQYKILSLPEVGLLFETSPNFRTMGTDPKSAPDPIGPHQLPFQLTDPSKKVVYVPPFNQWPSEGSWASFTYIVVAPPDEGDNDGPVQPSEPGLAVLTNAYGGIAGSDFNLADGGSGWTISGNLETVGGSKSSGLQHQAFAWGGLNRYVYGVDEVQNLDFATGLDLAKWYFEASPAVFNREALASSYGGVIRFTVRSQYGDFRSLNDPLDWVTIECESCDSGHGARIVRFVDESLRWDGTEQTVELFLNTNGRWMYDPLNTALDFQYATECQIASVLTNVSRIAILGDFTRGGEGVAIDDVAVISADASLQPAYPLTCQKGCFCRHNPGLVRPTCC